MAEREREEKRWAGRRGLDRHKEVETQKLVVHILCKASIAFLVVRPWLDFGRRLRLGTKTTARSRLA
jgi:hypothetical protein